MKQSFKSFLVDKNKPYLKLGPYKVEIISSTPIMLIINDIFSEDETEWLKTEAEKRLDTSFQVLPRDKHGDVSVSSQSHAAMLDVKSFTSGRKLLKTPNRISLATNLFTRPPFASEIWRVSTYGPAGMIRNLKY